MKKKAEGMSLRETFAIHRRAARDMRRIAPGCFMPFILCAVVEAASPYAVIWLSARLVDELSTLRRPEILAKWVLWIVAVSAAAELLKAVLESKTPRAVEYIIKVLTFAGVMTLSYFLMIKFMGIDPDLPDFLGKWAIPAIAILGIVTFLLYDYALSKLITFYCLRLSSKLRKILK